MTIRHECHYSNECQCEWCVLKIVSLKNFDVVHIIIIVVPGHTTELVQPGINRGGGGGQGGAGEASPKQMVTSSQEVTNSFPPPKK